MSISSPKDNATVTMVPLYWNGPKGERIETGKISFTPIGDAKIAGGPDSVSLLTAPGKWAYSATTKIDVPGRIENATWIVKIALEVESGIIGVGWLHENGTDWVARDYAVAQSGECELSLLIPAGTKGGKLVFDNQTNNGTPAIGMVRSITVEENIDQWRRMSGRPSSYPLRANDSGHSHLPPDLINPAPLMDKHVRNCRILASREELLEQLPKGGIAAEIGVASGRFSELIYTTTQPHKLALFDMTDQLLRCRIRERQGVEFFLGDSSTNLQAYFPDKHFDFIYIDGDHSLEGVWRDIKVAKRKVKSDGFLIFDDYQLFSYYEQFQPYGVVQCVNHLCVTESWELVFYSFRSDYAGYDNVAIRRMNVSGKPRAKC